MNENQTVPSSEYSVVDWLGYVLWILRSGIGSQLYHIKFSFPLEFATEFFFSLKNWTVVEETYTFMEI